MIDNPYSDRPQAMDFGRHVFPVSPGSAAPHAVAAPLTIGFVKYAVIRWWKVALPLALLISIGGSFVVWLMMGPTYRASAWIRIEDRRPHLAFDERDSPRFVQTHMEMVKSPLVLGPAMSDPDVAALPEVLMSGSPQDEVGGRISVKSVGNSELYQIHYDSPNRENAAKIVNAVLDSYMKVQSELADNQTQLTLELLDSELERRKNEIDRLRSTLKELTRQTTGKDPSFLGDIKDKNVVVAAQHPLHELNRRLADAEVTRGILEAERKAQQQLHQDAPPQPMSPQMIERAIENLPEVIALRNKAADEKNRLYQLETVAGRGPEHPSVKYLRDELLRTESGLADLRTKSVDRVTTDAELQKKLQREASVAELTTQLANQRALEEMLREKIAEEQEELKALGDRGLELEFARADLERATDVFTRIADRATAMRTEMRAPARVTALRRALPSETSLEKNPFKKMIAVFGFGLFAPFVLAVAWERRIKRIADSEQLKGESKLPVLAEVSQLPAVADDDPAIHSTRHSRVRAAYEESIDLLRNSLMLPESFQDLKVLSVASATSGEGKTSLACQLALSLARATSEQVLLIDADMRAPDIHLMFGLPLGPGLAQALEGKCSAAEVINRDWNPLVHIIPAGILERNPHVIVNAASMERLLCQVRDKYRYVVIDAPPLLAASEAFVISKSADGVIVCAMRDVSRGPQLRFACERLLSSGANPLGVVLSGVPWSDYAYRYGGYGYYEAVKPTETFDVAAGKAND